MLWFLQESTNLKAIHNWDVNSAVFSLAVIPTGKYQFESNSQPANYSSLVLFAVIPTGKYQFESNSQPSTSTRSRLSSCDSYRKVPIWKQFTTRRAIDSLVLTLWFLQESTNLKAIHNEGLKGNEQGMAVIPTGKYQFESNSQLKIVFSMAGLCCDSYRKVPIWKQFTTILETMNIWLQLWFLQESTNLKAIHNSACAFEGIKEAVIPTGKYQFESNSQLLHYHINYHRGCDSYRKVPIWKQFTTRMEWIDRI